jgi:hypothetical protein
MKWFDIRYTPGDGLASTYADCTHLDQLKA